MNLPVPPPLSLHLHCQGADADRWRRQVSACGLPLTEHPGGSHQVHVGPPERLVPLLQAQLLSSPAHTGGGPSVGGPITALGDLPAADTLASLSLAGLSGWWSLGADVGLATLATCLRADQARWQREHALREELQQARTQLDDRRWLDRAKGVLMQSCRLSEDEAFRLLRGAAMDGGLRLAAVARAVTEAAHYAEATNRAGRLRMLSQRIVKLHALAVAGVDAAGSRALLADSRQQVDQLLAALEHSLSRPTFGDLLDAAAQSWAAMREALAAPTSRASLARLDPQAERLLEQAERLTGALAAAGPGPSLSVINRSGRQRMLVQRLAKQALMASLLPEVALVPDDTVADFEQTLSYLRDAPLSTPPIRQALAAAQVAWQQMLAGATHPGTPAGRLQLARASEELLALFEDLTGRYEHSMQVLMG